MNQYPIDYGTSASAITFMKQSVFKPVLWFCFFTVQTPESCSSGKHGAISKENLIQRAHDVRSGQRFMFQQETDRYQTDKYIIEFLQYKNV